MGLRSQRGQRLPHRKDLQGERPDAARLQPLPLDCGGARQFLAAVTSTRDEGASLAISEASSGKAASSSLALRRYCCFTWKGRNALLKPPMMTSLRSRMEKPSCVWQSHSSFETVVSVTSRLSVLTVMRRPRLK